MNRAAKVDSLAQYATTGRCLAITTRHSPELSHTDNQISSLQQEARLCTASLSHADVSGERRRIVHKSHDTLLNTN